MVIVSIACITDMAAAGFNMANHTSHMSQTSHIITGVTDINWNQRLTEQYSLQFTVILRCAEVDFTALYCICITVLQYCICLAVFAIAAQKSCTENHIYWHWINWQLILLIHSGDPWPGLVPQPQVICFSDIYLLYVCQQTNTKDIAGQSASLVLQPQVRLGNLATSDSISCLSHLVELKKFIASLIMQESWV